MCGQQSYQYNKVNRYCTSINFVDRQQQNPQKWVFNKKLRKPQYNI